MKLFEDIKQKKRAFIVFLVAAAVVTFTLALINIVPIFSAVKASFALFVPFYIGMVLAYLLNPLMKLFEKRLFGKVKKPILKRVFAVILVYIILTAFLVALCIFILPNLFSSIASLVSEFPHYFEVFTEKTDEVLQKYPAINGWFDKYQENISDVLYQIATQFTAFLSGAVPQLVKITSQVTTTVVNIFLGIIISVYFLLKKERIKARSKRILTVLFKNDLKEKTVRVLRVTDEKTGRFIIGRIIDSLIMTVLCFIFMTLFRFPYPLLNCIIVGVFNLVPVFGSIISAIPTAFIVLITKPSAFLWYILFILAIQQFDGNILGPKIQGNQLGISALWIMFSVLLFGGLFGVLGMIIGVPLFAVIYYFVDESIEQGLIAKGKPYKTEDYM